MIAEPIGFWNTGVPVLVLGALAVLVPRWLCPPRTRSQGEVAVAIWAAAGVLLLVGAGLFVLIYAVSGTDVWGAFALAPVSTSMFFLWLSGFSALVWVPILALVWLGLAQGVEKRKGEDVALTEKETGG